MRLALINQFYLPDLSPTAQLAASLVEHRASLGDQVTVLAGSGSYAESPSDGWSGPPGARRPNVKVVRLWTPSLGKGRLARRMLDYGAFSLQAALMALTLPKQDVMILMTTPPYIALAGVLHRALHPSCRLILWNMDCYPETAERAGVIRPGGAVSRILRRVNQWLYRRLDSVVCLDGAMRDLVAPVYTEGGRPEVHVIPNWEPVALFPPGSSPPEWGPCTRLGLRGKTVVLYLGNAGSGHGFDTILESAVPLDAESVVFLFVGGGSGWRPLQEEVDRRGLKNVFLEGYVAKADIPSVLASAEAALITLRDSMLGVMSPSKLHAALAMGLPILYLGPPGGNVDEAILKHGCGVSLRHGEVAGAVSFIRRLRSDAAFRQELGVRARRAFEADYSDVQCLPRFDAIIDRASAEIASGER